MVTMINKDLALFCYPWDVIDEGYDAIINAVKRSGLNSNLLQNENIEALYLHSNKLSGIISNDICEGDEVLKLLIYGNYFCPPFPDCIKYIGKQICEK